MNRGVLAVVLAAAVAVAGGCSKAPSEEQCRELLDHLVDLEFKKAGATAGDAMKAELAKQKKAVSDAKSTEFIAACTEKAVKSRVECALAATDIDHGVVACDTK